MLVLAAAGIKLGIDTCRKLIYPLAYEDLIVKYAKEYELDKYLVMAVIKTESNFIYDAHSGKASGLMQLTDDTAQWVAEKMKLDSKSVDLMDPKDNIRMGCYYLRYLIDKYEGNIDLALAAYNGGMGNVRKWLEDEKYSGNGKDLDHIPFKETREYVQKVNKQWKNYKEMYQ